MADSNELNEKTKKAAEKIDNVGKSADSVTAAMEKAAEKIEKLNFNVLQETNRSIIAALKLYGKAVQEETNQVEEANLTTKKVRLQGDRLKRAYGQFGDGIFATIKMQNNLVAQAGAQYNLAQAATAQAAALLDANANALKAARQESDEIKKNLIQKRQERLGIQHLIELKKKEAADTRLKIEAAKQEQAAIDGRKSDIRNANAQLQKEADSSRDLQKFMESQISAASNEIKASEDKVKSLEANRDAQTSQIDTINEEIRKLEKRGEFKGRGKEKPSKEDLARAEALKLQEKGILAAFEASKEAIIAEKARTRSLRETIPGMEAERDAAIEAATANESEIAKNNESLAKEGLNRLALSEAIVGMESTVKKLSEEQKQLTAEEDGLTTEISKLQQAAGQEQIKIKALNKERENLAKAHADLADEEETVRQQLINAKFEKFQKVMSAIEGAFKNAATEINNLVGPILELQKQFGISAGSAAKLKFENLMASAQSYITSLTSLGKTPGVSSAEIQDTQTAFKGEFGGVLTSDAARGLAEEAKRLGVSAGDMAKARRVFMTQTMGNVGDARTQQNKLMAEFAKKGLTSSDAMEAIGKYSELAARNGSRFQQSFFRAAADAKKIGVDLSKIDQVGDNIIDNFEGFLESQSELGAMGFGFDTNKLAQLAEGGDTGALMDELRSQLAATGKDITKLRRSEQLALSKGLGLSMEEIQRLGAPKGAEGSGEETLKPEELQKDANEKLGQAVFFLASIAGILTAVSGTVAIMNSKMAMGAIRGAVRMFGGGAATGKAASGGMMSKIKGMLGRGGAGPTEGGAVAPTGGGPAPTAPTGGTSAPTAPGGGMASFMDKLSPSKMLAGAGALLIVAGAMFVAAKALQEFGKVEWGSMGKAGVALLGLVGAVAGLGAIMMSGIGAVAILAGAAAMLTIASSLLLLGVAINSIGNGLPTFATGMAELGKVLTDFPIGKLAAFGPAAMLAVPGMMALSVAGAAMNAVKGIGKFLGIGSPEATSPTTPAAPSTAGVQQAVAAQQTGTAPVTPATQTVSVDMTRLEQKLDAVVNAISSMRVEMDGTKVGKILVNSNESATSLGVFRQGARATL
jgi:hypothetical protein